MLLAATLSFGPGAMSADAALAEERPGPAQSILRPLAYADIPSWAEDDHAAAFRAFLATCRPIIDSSPAVRLAQPTPPDLVAACRAAQGRATDGASTRAFFETRFAPYEVVPAGGAGFLTGYYEPEVSGARAATPEHHWPIRGKPADLVPGEIAPDRDAIEAGALGAAAPPLLHVRDEVEAFFIHVQGSARIRFDDGEVTRLAYAGRNGHPYTGVGRLLVTEFGLTPEDVTLEKLKAWLRAHPDEGRALMRRNRSYIFFRIADELKADDGPIGGAGAPLAPQRALAVDRALWSYGLPFFIIADDLPEEVEPSRRIARLTIAQDTGSAIVGPARGDLFFGSGEAMGRRAGALRHAARFIVLSPRAATRDETSHSGAR